MKIDFTRLEIEISFDGKKQTVNIARQLGNMMKYGSSILLDIGFEELAREIYFSDGEIEIPERYIEPVIAVVRESNFLACVKREIINRLTNKNQ